MANNPQNCPKCGSESISPVHQYQIQKHWKWFFGIILFYGTIGWGLIVLWFIDIQVITNLVGFFTESDEIFMLPFSIFIIVWVSYVFVNRDKFICKECCEKFENNPT